MGCRYSILLACCCICLVGLLLTGCNDGSLWCPDSVVDGEIAKSNHVRIRVVIIAVRSMIAVVCHRAVNGRLSRALSHVLGENRAERLKEVLSGVPNRVRLESILSGRFGGVLGDILSGGLVSILLGRLSGGLASRILLIQTVQGQGSGCVVADLADVTGQVLIQLREKLI